MSILNKIVITTKKYLKTRTVTWRHNYNIMVSGLLLVVKLLLLVVYIKTKFYWEINFLIKYLLGRY